MSEGEIRRALAAGIPGERIVFSGVGKTSAELTFALRHGVSQINVESEPELMRLSALARALGVRPAVVIRVNPDVGAGGHAKISTGKADNKFGVSLAEAERLYAVAAAVVLSCDFLFFLGAKANGFFDVRDKNFFIANFARPR